MKKILFALVTISVLLFASCGAPAGSTMKQNGPTYGVTIITRNNMVDADIMSNLEYWFDKDTNLCYAIIVSSTYGANYVISMTQVDYLNVKLSGVKVHYFHSMEN